MIKSSYLGKFLSGILALGLIFTEAVQAVEVPPASSVLDMQTNGALAAVTLGDWYSSTTAGAGSGYHYLEFIVPDAWPAATPIYLDLYSPELNCNNPRDENDAGGNSIATYELYSSGTAYSAWATPAPGAAGSLGAVDYPPVIDNCGSAPQWQRINLPFPTVPGSYLLRTSISDADQNSWRLRIGLDNDGDPNTTPPANTDNPDGVPGSGDELGATVLQSSFQHDVAGSPCIDQYQFVNGSPASITFNNFDMDGNVSVTYHAPNGTSITGTVSGNGIWNSSATISRVGDTVTAAAYGGPLNGLWRSEACFNSNNQVILEMQGGIPWLFDLPQFPDIALSKTDGETEVSAGQFLTYTISFTNNGTGAAIDNVLTDTLQTGAIYIGCSINPPFNGAGSSCSHSAGVVNYVLSPDLIASGASGSVTLDVQVDPAYLRRNFVNTTDMTYEQLWHLSSYSASATDIDGFVVLPTDLQIVKTAAPDPVEKGGTLIYTLTITNNGPGIAPNVVVTDTLPSEVTWVSTTPSQGNCSDPGGVICELGNILNGASATVLIEVTVN